MDEIDIAQELEMRIREEAIKKAQDPLQAGKGTETCTLVKVGSRTEDGCGERLSEERRQVGATSCIDCQEWLEQLVRFNR